MKRQAQPMLSREGQQALSQYGQVLQQLVDDDEEDALVAAVNATGTLCDQTIMTLLLHTGLRARTLYIDTPAGPSWQAKRKLAVCRKTQESTRGSAKRDCSSGLTPLCGDAFARGAVSVSFGKDAPRAHWTGTGAHHHKVCDASTGHRPQSP